MSNHNHNIDCLNGSSKVKASSDGFASNSQQNVGLLAMAAYFPKTYVSQRDLELYDNVGAGKYTKGLMQDKMAFCTDLEDINSIALTVTRNLLEQTGIPLSDIGYLEVGTETILDKSKSIKTVLMQLFEESGNTDIEGVDTINACYGGTAALFHAIDHCSSPFWDGRAAIVVAADIAVYDKGSARPTGGCGAVAMLIGSNAPLVFDPFRATQMTNTYDFYKPDPTSEYPIVDGKLSLQAYITTLDKCSQIYRTKHAKYKHQTNGTNGTTRTNGSCDNIGPILLLDEFDAILLHSPYCKLVRKAFARLMFNDYRQLLSDSNETSRQKHETEMSEICKDNKLLERVVLNLIRSSASLSNYNDWITSIGDTTLERVAIQLSERAFKEKTEDSLYLSNQIGNMYTASLYACLISYLTSKPSEKLINNKLLFFSYGSGSAASMFSARLTGNVNELNKLVSGLRDVRSKLSQRVRVSPDEFNAHLEHRKRTFSLANRYPTGKPVSDSRRGDSGIDLGTYLYADTYYLTEVDGMFRRRYKRYELDGLVVTNGNDIH